MYTYCDCVYKKSWSSCGLTCNFLYHILKQMGLSRSYQTYSDGVGSKRGLRFSVMVFVVIIAVSVTSGGFLRMQSSCRVSSRLLKLPVSEVYCSFFDASFNISVINHFGSLDETVKRCTVTAGDLKLHLAFS